MSNCLMNNNLCGLARTHNLAGCLEQAPPELGPLPMEGPSDHEQDPVLKARPEAAALYGRR